MRRVFSLLFVTLLLAVAAVFYAKEVREARRLRAHVRGDNTARMTGLHVYLVYAASSDPDSFKRALGTGGVIEATAIHSDILRNFPFEMTPQEVTWDLKDTWHHPFHLAYSLKTEPPPGKGAKYHFAIWSSGPDGINDNGRGDDVSISNMIIPIQPFSKAPVQNATNRQY
jgi:hypothetical protein